MNTKTFSALLTLSFALLLSSCDGDAAAAGELAKPRPKPVAQIIYSGSVLSFDISANQQQIIASCAGGKLSKHELSTGKHISTAKYNGGSNPLGCYSPDGTKIATAGRRNILILDAATDNIAAQVDDDPYNYVFSPDGEQMASLSLSGTIQVTKIFGGDITFQKKIKSTKAICFSPDGKHIASGGDDATLQITDLSNQSTTFSLECGERIQGIKYSPNAQYIVLELNHCTLQIIDLNKGESITQFEVTGTYGSNMDFSPDSQHLSYVDPNNVIKTIELKPSGETVLYTNNDEQGQATVKSVSLMNTVFEKKMEEAIVHLQYTPDGKYLGVSQDSRVVFIDLESSTKEQQVNQAAQEEPQLISCNNAIESLEFSPDSKLLAIGMQKGQALVQDWQSKKNVFVLTQGDSPITATFTADGDQLEIYYKTGKKSFSSIHDTVMASYTLSTGEMLTERKYEKLSASAYSPKNHFFIMHDQKKSPSIIDTSTNKSLIDMRTWKVNALACSPDKKTLTTTPNNQTAFIVDIANRKILYTIPIINQKPRSTVKNIRAIAYSDDSSHVALGCSDGEILVIDLATGKTIRTITGSGPITQIGFSPDGKHLAYAQLQNEHFGLCELSSGTIHQHKLHTTPINIIQFSPDSQYLATSNYKDGAVIIKVSTGEVMKKIEAKDIFAISFSQDSKHFALGGQDGNVFIHTIDTK